MTKTKKYNYLALFLCAVTCIGWSYIVDLKYYRLSYFGWDLCLYSNLMWNLCHGSVATSLFGKDFLVDHFDLIAFLLIPFYYFFQSALMVLYFKLFAFFVGAYVFYLLTAKRLGGFWGILFLLGYVFYPANVALVFFEFNFENIAIPIIFLIFYYFEEKKYSGFMLSCLLLTMVKENMPLVVFMFGVYGFMTRSKDWLLWGLCPLLLGAVTFIGEVFVVIPWLRHGYYSNSAYWNLYSSLGKSPLEIAHSLIFNWPKVFKALFNMHNTAFILSLSGPLLLFSLLSPLILLIAAPLFLQNLLSNFYGQQSIFFFYSSTLAVFIFMATIDFLGRVNFEFKKYFLALVIILLFRFDAGFWPQWQARMPVFKENQAAAEYLISQVPPKTSVMASYKFLPMLSQRRDLHVIYFRQNKFTYEKEEIPEDVNYMVADFAGMMENKANVKYLLNQGNWKIQAAFEEMVMLKKNAVSGETLISSRFNPFLSMKPLQNKIRVGKSLILEGLEMPSSLKSDQRLMRVVFYWNVLNDDKNVSLSQITLRIFQGNRVVYLRNRIPFYGLPLLKKEHDREVFYYFIPQLEPGAYKMILSTVNSNYIGTYRYELKIH